MWEVEVGMALLKGNIVRVQQKVLLVATAEEVAHQNPKGWAEQMSEY